jgi:hypothetical protein
MMNFCSEMTSFTRSPMEMRPSLSVSMTSRWRTRFSVIRTMHSSLGVSASVVDITRYKNAESELKEADCRKDEFLAMPLTVLGADSRTVGMGG